MRSEAEYLGRGIWSKGAGFPDLPTRPHFVLATCYWCLKYYSVIYLSQLNSLGYRMCWRMLIKDHGILETSLYWQAFEGVGRSASTCFLPNVLQSLQKFAGKLCVPIFIVSSSQSPVRHDNYSNWYYLTQPRFAGMSKGLIFMHDRCSPITKCTYIALLILKRQQFWS